MWFNKHHQKSFKSVGVAFILTGAIIFGISAAFWLLNMVNDTNYIGFSYFKAFSGLVLLGVGYIILELDLMRIK